MIILLVNVLLSVPTTLRVFSIPFRITLLVVEYPSVISVVSLCNFPPSILKLFIFVIVPPLEFTSAFTSVSYTHLDVYKRQPPGTASTSTYAPLPLDIETKFIVGILGKFITGLLGASGTEI